MTGSVCTGHGPQTWQFKSCVAIPLRIASNINMNYACVASCVWVLTVLAYTVKATANDRQCMYRPLASNKRAIYYLVGGRFLVLNLLAHLRILIEEMR